MFVFKVSIPSLAIVYFRIKTLEGFFSAFKLFLKLNPIRKPLNAFKRHLEAFRRILLPLFEGGGCKGVWGNPPQSVVRDYVSIPWLFAVYKIYFLGYNKEVRKPRNQEILFFTIGAKQL